MITEDKLAAATIAQLFGSELFRAQQNARTDSGSVPDIVKLDPKQFLVSKAQQQTQNMAEQNKMLAALQREAELACPLPQETLTNNESQHTGSSNEEVKPVSQQQAQPSVSNPDVLIASSSNTILEKIANQLVRIADCLESNSNKDEDQS